MVRAVGGHYMWVQRDTVPSWGKTDLPQEGGDLMAKGKSGSGSYRSAKTGRYVTASYGKSHPSTTVKESK